MKVAVESKPKFAPITVTLTLESLEEARTFRCLVGNTHDVSKALALSISHGWTTEERISALCRHLQEVVPYSIYAQKD